MLDELRDVVTQICQKEICFDGCQAVVILGTSLCWVVVKYAEQNTNIYNSILQYKFNQKQTWNT